MVSLVAVIFYTGATYYFYYNKGDFVGLEENMLPRKIKGIAKGLDISGFGIVTYYVSSDSWHMIALRYQAYYVPVLPKYLCIIFPQGICTSEGYTGFYIAHFHDEHDSYVKLNLR